MKTLTVTIGHNVRGEREHMAAAVLDAFEARTGCQAYTAIECAGAWMGVREASTRIEVCALEDARAEWIAAQLPALAADLGQESIMYEVRECAAMFAEPAAAAATA